MKSSRPVDARLWAAREDPGLQSELGAEYTRPYGDCHEHAARFDRHMTIGKGPGFDLSPGEASLYESNFGPPADRYKNRYIYKINKMIRGEYEII